MLSKSDAKKLLEPLQARLQEIAQAANIEDPGYEFPIKKTTRANLRHDAMTAKAAELLEGDFECIQDVRTGIWANEKCALRFRKMKPSGAVRGVPTKRATDLKQAGQLTLFAKEEKTPQSVPVFYVGYQTDKDTDEIEDYLISAYEGGAPVWVMSFDELADADISPQAQLPMLSPPAQRTQVRVKDAAKTPKDNQNGSSTQ